MWSAAPGPMGQLLALMKPSVEPSLVPMVGPPLGVQWMLLGPQVV